MGIEALILAAGFSSRAGEYKMSLAIGGKTVLERCIECLHGFCARLIVIGGYDCEKIKYLPEKYSKVELVFNDKYEDGMYSSILKGLDYLSDDRFFILPGDCPVISQKTIETLAQTDGDIVVPVYKGQRGNPVLLKSSLIKKIKNAGFDNMQDFINSYGFKEVEVEDKGILMDIDTPEDFKNVCEFYNNSSDD